MFWGKKDQKEQDEEKVSAQSFQSTPLPIVETHLGGWMKTEETEKNICTNLTPEGEKYLESLKTLPEVFAALKAIHHASEVRIVANLVNGGGQVIAAKPAFAYKMFVQYLENKLEEIIKTDPKAIKVLQKSW